MTKLKNSSCDKTKRTKNVTKLKNSNFDETQKLKLGQNSKKQIVKKRRKKISNCDTT